MSLYLLAVLCDTVAASVLSLAPFAGLSNSTFINSTSPNQPIIPQGYAIASKIATTALIAEPVPVVTVYRLIEQTQTKYVNFCACPSSMSGAAGNQISVSLENPDSLGVAHNPVGPDGSNDSDTHNRVSTGAGGVASKAPEVIDAVHSQEDQHFVVSVTIATVYQTLEPITYTTMIPFGGSISVQTLTATSTKTLLTTSTITLPVIETSSSSSGVDSKPIYSNSTISIGTPSPRPSSASSTPLATSTVTSTLHLENTFTQSFLTTSNKASAGIDCEGRSTPTTSFRVEIPSTTLVHFIPSAQSFTTSIGSMATSSERRFTEMFAERSSTLRTVSDTTSDYTTTSATPDYTTTSAAILVMSSSSSSSRSASIFSTISYLSVLDLTTFGPASITLSSLDTISSTLTSSITAEVATRSTPTASTTDTTSEAVLAFSRTDIQTTLKVQSSSSSNLPSEASHATLSPSSMTSADLPSSASSTTSLFTTTSVAKPVAVPSQQAVVNTDFEMDLDGSGTFTRPWVFSGNGDVQSNTNNAYQSYSGEHFGVLYGRSSTTASMSQTLLGVEPGFTYTLSYFYNVEQASPQAICSFVTTLGGQVVDTITSPTTRTGGYRNRQVTYMPPTDSDGTVLLKFTLTCPRFVQLTAQSNYALDLITLTLNSES